MVVNCVSTAMHMTLDLQLLKHLLEVLILHECLCVSIMGERNHVHQSSKAMILGVGGLENMSNNSFVVPFLYFHQMELL